MKTTSKVSCILLVAILLVSGFGCKKSDENSQTSKTKSSTISSVKTTPRTSAVAKSTIASTTQEQDNENPGHVNTDDSEEVDMTDNSNTDDNEFAEEITEEEAMDLGGKTIIIANTYPKPGVDEVQDIIMERIKWTEERFNCKIEFINMAFNPAKNEYLKYHVAGLYWADIIGGMNTAQGIPLGIVNSGVAVPLDDLIDFDKEIYNVPSLEGTIWKGVHYGIPQAPFNSMLQAMLFNADIIQTEGLMSPYDRFKDGTWTWDVMTDYAQKLTKDFNGDGTPDQWGLTFTVASGYGAQYDEGILASNGGQAIVKDANGKFKVGINEVNALRGIQFMQDLKHVYKVTGPDGTFENGSAAMSFSHVGIASDGVKKGTFPESTHYTAFPMGPDAADFYAHDLGSLFEWVPLTAPDYKASARIAEAVYCYWDENQPYSMKMNEAIKKSLEGYCMNENDLDVMVSLQFKLFPLYRRHFAVANSVFKGKIMKEVNSSFEPIMTIIDRHIVEMQAKIDEVDSVDITMEAK